MNDFLVLLQDVPMFLKVVLRVLPSALMSCMQHHAMIMLLLRALPFQSLFQQVMNLWFLISSPTLQKDERKGKSNGKQTRMFSSMDFSRSIFVCSSSLFKEFNSSFCASLLDFSVLKRDSRDEIVSDCKME